MSEEEGKVLIEKLRRTLDLLRMEAKTTRTLVEHDREMWLHRIAALEKITGDVEDRMRENTEGVTEFRMYMKLAGIGGIGGMGMGGLALVLQIIGSN